MDGIKVDWHLENDTFVLNAEIPAHREATVRLPYSGRTTTIREGRHTLKEQINN
jgi:hypothetical protein